MTNYEKFQLQWMIDHDHSLGELISALRDYQYDDPEDSDRISTPVSELFNEWEQDVGFDGEIWPCENEYYICDDPLVADNDEFTQDVISYLNLQDDAYFEARGRKKEDVLADKDLIERIASEHRKCVESFGNEREWSVKDACDNEPGIS